MPQVTNQLLHAPNTALPGLISSLQPLLTREAAAVLSHQWSLLQKLYVVRKQRAGASSSSSTSAGAADEDEQQPGADGSSEPAAASAEEGEDSEEQLAEALRDGMERVRALGQEFKESLGAAAAAKNDE